MIKSKILLYFVNILIHFVILKKRRKSHVPIRSSFFVTWGNAITKRSKQRRRNNGE